MASIFRLLILAPFGVLVILLAAANRQKVTLSFDPMGGDLWSLQLPLFVALLAAVMIGILIGGIATWVGQSRYRRAARDYGREAKEAQGEVQRLRTLVPTADAVALPPTMIR